MRNHHRAAGKGFQAFFQGAERVHVDVVGGLVEQQHVAFTFEGEGQVHAVPFPARQDTGLFPLVGTPEIEAGDVRAGIDQAAAQVYLLVAFRNHFPYRLFGIYAGVLLVHIAQFHGGTHFERAFIGFFQAHDQAEERGLARAVGADDADDAGRRKLEIEVVEQYFVAECLAHMYGFDDIVPQPGAVGNVDFQAFFLLLAVLVHHLLVGVQTGLAFCLTCLGRHPYPFQLAFKGLAAA